MNKKERTTAQWTNKPLAEKHALLEEYEALPPGQKRDWRRAQGVSMFTLSYHRSRAVKKTPRNTVRNELIAAAILKEYDALAMGAKAQWLKEHKVSYDAMTRLRSGASIPYQFENYQPATSTAIVPVAHLEAHLPSYRPPRRANGKALAPPPEPKAHEVTVDDLIMSLEIRQKLFGEFISLVKGIKDGSY